MRNKTPETQSEVCLQVR